MPLLALAMAATLSASDVIERPPEAEVHPVPAWLPRGASLTLFVNSPAVTPALRLQWEAAFYEQPRNHLTAVLCFGTGLSANLPAGRGRSVLHSAKRALESTRAAWRRPAPARARSVLQDPRRWPRSRPRRWR